MFSRDTYWRECRRISEAGVNGAFENLSSDFSPESNHMSACCVKEKWESMYDSRDGMKAENSTIVRIPLTCLGPVGVSS